MTVYVIDASVGSRFLLTEDLSNKARLILEDFLVGSLDLEAPELINYEVGNTLWKASKQKLLTPEESVRKLSYFLTLRLASVELNQKDHQEILKWSLETGTTYYDSTYVRATKKTEATLLTADDILLDKARKAVPTLHLRDYCR